MRSYEFLKEASVFKKEKNQYVPGYRMSISTKGGGIAIKIISTVIPDFEPSEELVIVPQDTPSDVQVPLTKATPASFKLKRANGQVVELQGTESGIESSLNGLGPAIDASKPEQQKMPNKGDTAEALLGAAMFAKLIKREKGHIGNITTDDVWAVFDELKPVSDTDWVVEKKDLGGAVDKIWFGLKVKGFVRNALSNPDIRKKLTGWAMSPVNYVNSKEGQDYADQFYKNGQPDEIGVLSDGLSEQASRKSDVYTVVRDPETGQIAKELLPISLKAGAEQFAQHSGSNWKAMETMFGKIGLLLDDSVKMAYEADQKAGNQIKAATEVYKVVVDIFNSRIRTDKDEAAFIEKFTGALRSWATSDNDNVRLVSFGSKGSYEVLRFDNLLPKMQTIDLKAEFVPGENPKILFKDDKQGVLFSIRTYLQQGKKGFYQRNVIEKGPLLSKLASAIEDEPKQVDKPDELSAIKKNAGITKPRPAGQLNQQRPLKVSQVPMGTEPIQSS